MPLTHIDDITLQKIAHGELSEEDFSSHLTTCIKCSENVRFYKTMLESLSQKLDSGFSANFAYSVVEETTRISEQTRKIKSILSFGIILILTFLPFFLFTGSLPKFNIVGDSFAKAFSFVSGFMKSYNLASWTTIAVVLLFIIIQAIDQVLNNGIKRKRFH